MKKYIVNMSIQEIIKRLLNGEVLLNDECPENKIYMLNGVIIKESESHYIIGDGIVKRDSLYFEVEEQFEIKETGLYKTRDGRKVFVSYIEENEDVVYTVYGMIEGEVTGYYWTKEGREIVYETNNTDIVSKWE